MKRLLLAVALVAALIPATAQALPSDCNAIVSMSQGHQTYEGSDASGESELEGLTGEQWMGLFAYGKVLSWWTNPALWGLLAQYDRCGTDAEIDSVVFLFDPYGSGTCSQGPNSAFVCDDGTTMLNHLDQVLAIIAARYPNAEAYLTMLVGGAGHVTCFVNQFGQLKPVRASRTHAARIGQMTLPEIGPDLDVNCAGGYSDNLGHLTAAGADSAQSQVADWFNGLEQELVIPPTIPHPGINGTNGFRIGVTDLTTNTLLWNAPYLHVTPYVPNSGWLNGDRLAYHCAFAFMQLNEEIIGRVAFRSVPTEGNNPDGAYIRINDTYMEEAGDVQQTDPAGGPNRFFDGSVNSTGMQGGGSFGECPQNVGVEYEPGSFPDERPNVVYYTGNQAVELRDYATTNPAPGVTFDLVELITSPFVLSGFPFSADHTVTSRASVLARYNSVPVAVVYYDGLGDGQVLVEGDTR